MNLLMELNREGMTVVMLPTPRKMLGWRVG